MIILLPRRLLTIARVYFPLSPFKASSVKTKVEAFEAALGTPGVKPASTKTTSVLPEARVLLKRLTDEELKKACASKKKLSESIKETNVKNCTFVLDEENSETEKKSERKVNINQFLIALVNFLIRFNSIYF